MATAEAELMGVNASIAVSSPAFDPDEPIRDRRSRRGAALAGERHRLGLAGQRHVFALDTVPRFESRPGRTELLDKIKGHVLAKGVLIGTYERK